MPKILSKETQGIIRFYTSLLNKHGHSPHACDFSSEESQQKRFHVLADVTNMTGKHVLDVGCGFADFADYLRNRFGPVSYTGVDINPQMIEQARQLRPHLSLQTLDILRTNPGDTYDVVTAGGIFYLLQKNPEEKMCKMITRLWDLTNHALAFNTLSSWWHESFPRKFHADPYETLEFCRTLTPWVTLRHDYMPHDFTIYMYRNQT